MKKTDRADVMHGVLLMALFSFSAFYISGFDFVQRLSLSPLIVGIVLGMLYANSLRGRLPATWVPGIRLCTKQVLRAGVVLYGFRLTFQSVAAVGLPAIAADAVVVAGSLLLALLLGRLLGMDRQTVLLTGTGSAICGAAAVLGAEPVVGAAPHKTAVAVSTVVIFGTLSMFVYPVMYRTGLLSGLSETGVAVYVGATLHEVAHVVGAGNAIDASGACVADAATITKMIRVMMLAPVLVVMGLLLRRGGAAAPAGRAGVAIPWFAVWFLVVIGINSLLQQTVPSAVLVPCLDAVAQVDTFMLTMAMTALGAETGIEKFRQAGARPFLLAAGLYVWLVGGGYLIARTLC